MFGLHEFPGTLILVSQIAVQHPQAVSECSIRENENKLASYSVTVLESLSFIKLAKFYFHSRPKERCFNKNMTIINMSKSVFQSAPFSFYNFLESLWH